MVVAHPLTAHPKQGDFPMPPHLSARGILPNHIMPLLLGILHHTTITVTPCTRVQAQPHMDLGMVGPTPKALLPFLNSIP